MELLRLALWKVGIVRTARSSDRASSEDHICRGACGGASGRFGVCDAIVGEEFESARRYWSAVRRVGTPTLYGARILFEVCEPDSVRDGSDPGSEYVPAALPVPRDTRRI